MLIILSWTGKLPFSGSVLYDMALLVSRFFSLHYVGWTCPLFLPLVVISSWIKTEVVSLERRVRFRVSKKLKFLFWNQKYATASSKEQRIGGYTFRTQHQSREYGVIICYLNYVNDFFLNQYDYIFFDRAERKEADFLWEMSIEATAVLLPEPWDLVARPEATGADAFNDDGEGTSDGDLPDGII